MTRAKLLNGLLRISPAAFLVILSTCAIQSHAETSCTVSDAEESWQLQMRADSSAFEVKGSVFLSSRGGRTDMVAVSADGAGEPLNFPLELTGISADSIALKFAPIGYSLKGVCSGAQQYTGRFSVPQPPFRDIVGSFTLTRADIAP